MTPGEFLHRVGEQWAIGRLRRLQGDLPGAPGRLQPARFGFCHSGVSQLPALPWAAVPTGEQAGALLAGECPALGWPWRWDGSDGVWHGAPDTGRTWPSVFFSQVPYRAGNPYGDARVVWEPARLQQLVAVALVARADGGRRSDAVRLVESALDSWVRANPPFQGVHYVSAMECALRLLAVCHALDLVRGDLSEPDRAWSNLLRLVDSHARLIRARLSLHSSAGNHTVAEAAGLVYAGTLFPELPGAADWCASGLALLAEEAERQVLPDGGGLEQAVWYQLFVVDLLGLVEALLQGRRQPVPSAIASAVRRGREFLSALADNHGVLPRFGDCDDGYALSEYLCLSVSGTPAAVGTRTFPSAGYTVVRWGEGGPWRMVLDHGPLGMPPSFGHGHADALSVLLWVDGREVFIDPGTFTYTGDAGWRRWFRGTSAHNTVTVDGEDQAQQETAFQWSRPYRARLVWSETGADGTVRLLASHDGYQRRGVEHWRGVACHPGGSLVVLDRLVGTGTHRSDLRWHLGGEVAQHDGAFELALTPARVGIQVSGGAVTVVRDGPGPDRAWRSPRYGVREPGVVLQCRQEGRLPHEFLTAVRLGAPADVPRAALDQGLESLRARMP